MSKRRMLLIVITIIIILVLGVERYMFNNFVAAIQNQDSEKIEQLIELPYINLNRRGGEGWSFSFLTEITAMTPLEAACETGNIEVAEKLIEHGANAADFDYGYFSPVYITLQTEHDNDLEMLKLLIENGADPRGMCASEIMDENSLLQISRRHVTSDLNASPIIFEASGYEYDKAVKTVEIYKYLESVNEEKNPVDELGETPLMYAVSCKNIELVNYLLESGHDVNELDIRGENALFYLVDSKSVIYDDSWRKEVFDLLIKYDIDIMQKNIDGMTVSEYAVEEGDSYMVSLLG